MYKSVVKRCFDIMIAIVGLVIAMLGLVVLAPIIFLTDRGPIFYNSLRIGRNGKPFKMHKFRSMYVNAPDIRLADNSTYNAADDPRVTPIGRLIRKTSLDELPQFWNIFKGEMSLIGPRPDPLDWLDRYPEDIRIFLTVRPGITGYNQAYFRNDADGEEKMKNDVYYVSHCSLWMDIKIFFKTIAVVLLQQKTYKDTSLEDDAMKQAEGIELAPKEDEKSK